MFFVLDTLCGNTQSHQAGKSIKLGKKAKAARKKALAKAMKKKGKSDEEDESGSESGEGDTKRDRAKVRKFHLIFDTLPDHVQEVWKQVFFYLLSSSIQPSREKYVKLYIYIHKYLNIYIDIISHNTYNLYLKADLKNAPHSPDEQR